MADPLSVDEIREAAVRAAGASGPAILEHKAAAHDPPVTLADIAARVGRNLPNGEGRVAVVDAVVSALLRPELPTLSLDAIGGMAGLAAADFSLSKGLAELTAILGAELGHHSLTRTPTWEQLCGGTGSPGTREVLFRIAEHDNYDLFDCAADNNRSECDRRLAIELLDLRYRRKLLSRAEVAAFGRILTDVLPTVADNAISYYGVGMVATWCKLDTAGAEAALKREFEATGKLPQNWLHALRSIKRRGEALERWVDWIRDVVVSRVSSGQFIEVDLGKIWINHRPDECESYLASLSMAAAPEPVRQGISWMLEMRDTPAANRILDDIVGLGGYPATAAAALRDRGNAKLRRSREAAAAKEWNATRSSESLKRIYVDFIDNIEEGTKFDRWMTLLGADGVREPYTFRSADGRASLFVDVDRRGRLQGWKFDE